MLTDWGHVQEKAVKAPMTQAPPHHPYSTSARGDTENTAEAKFITVTPEINLASGTMVSCN